MAGRQPGGNARRRFRMLRPVGRYKGRPLGRCIVDDPRGRRHRGRVQSDAGWIGEGFVDSAQHGSLAGVVLPAVCTDAKGTIQEVTPSFAALLGVDVGDALGLALPGIFAPQDRPLVDRQLELVDGGQPTGDLVVRLQLSDRMVPCVVGVSAAGADESSQRVVWVVVRAGTWAAYEPWDVTVVAQELGRLVAGSASAS